MMLSEPFSQREIESMAAACAGAFHDTTWGRGMEIVRDPGGGGWLRVARTALEHIRYVEGIRAADMLRAELGAG